MAWLSVAILLLLAACDGSGDVSGSTPDASVTAQPTSSPGAGADDDRVVEEGETVTSGEYLVGTFQPEFSFRFEGERPLRVSRQSDRLLILDLEVPRQLVFARPDRVYTYRGGRPALRPTPDDLAGWLESNPHVKVKRRSRTSVGGEKGDVVDIVVTSVPGGKVGGCPISCLPLVPLGIGDLSIFLAEGEEARFTFLDAGKEQFFILVSSSPPELEEALAAAEELLDTVRF